MHSTLHGERTEVRPTGPDDLHLLVAWHDDREINRWWDGPLDARVIAEKYLGTRSPNVECFNPPASNTGAIRGYEKAGFRIEASMEGEPPWVLIAAQPSTLGE